MPRIWIGVSQGGPRISSFSSKTQTLIRTPLLRRLYAFAVATTRPGNVPERADQASREDALDLLFWTSMCRGL